MSEEDELRERCMNLETDLKSLQPIIAGLIRTPEFVTLGDMKFWLERMQELVNRNINKAP